MARIIIEIDKRNKSARSFISYIKTLSFIKVKEEVNYDPKFVKKVLDSDKNDERYSIKTENIWDGI